MKLRKSLEAIQGYGAHGWTYFVAGIGLISGIIGIWVFIAPDRYPVVTLDLSDDFEFTDEEWNPIELQREIEFIETLFVQIEKDQPFIIDLRLGDIRSTLEINDDTYVRAVDLDANYVGRQLEFLTIGVEGGCHESANHEFQTDPCNNVFLFFDKPATTTAYTPHLEEDHPLARIFPNEGPGALTFILSPETATVESSKFDFRMHSYVSVVYGSGGQGEHHYYLSMRASNPDTYYRSLE